MTRTRIPAACALVLLIGGCGGLAGGGGGGGATKTSRISQTAGAVSRAESTHEYPAPAPAHESVPITSPAAGAAQAVRAFATRYINWSASNVTARMESLALDSVGQARSAMALAAAQTRGDYELKRGGISNQGTVEAVAALPGHRAQYVVVTREQTTATNTDAYQGLRPAWHVALASAERLAPGQWVVSRWQPEN